MIESVQVEKNDEGHYCVAIAPPTGDYLTSSETGYLAFIAALEDGDVVCFKQDEALSDTGTAIAFEADYAGVDKDGRAVFGNLRSHSGTSFDESENAWMGEFCEACLSTMELMPYDIQAVGWQMTEDGVFSYDQELPNPYEQDQQNIIDAVHDIEKDAEVRFDDDQIRVILNLPMDSEFPQAVVEKTKVLYELVDLENPKHLENPKYSTLLIAFVDEDSDTKERARLWFTRWYVSDSIKPRIELSGVFANGRVEQYKDEVVSLVENDKELKGLIAEYGIYKEF